MNFSRQRIQFRTLYRLVLAIALAGLAVGVASRGHQSSAQSTCLPDPNGLVAWYQFENDGSDKTGVNQATLSGNPAFASGKVGNALQLDGNGTYARAYAASNLNVGAGSGFTVEGWIKVNDVTNTHGIVSWNGYYSSQGGDVVLFTNFDRLTVYVDHVEGGQSNFQTDAGIIVPNTWQHVALTYDRASGLESLYVDGQLRKSINAGSFTAFTTSDVYIGRSRPSITNDFAGAIDELSIYNRGLSSAEIAAIYNAGANGKCAPTPTPTPECTSLPSGAVASYALDSNGTDRTGANPATISGTNSFPAGKVDKALQFDGTTTFAKANASTSLDVGAGPGLTIETWIKADDVNGRKTIARWDNNGSGGIEFDLSGNHLLVNLLDTSFGNHSIFSGSFNPDITPNMWNHVAITYDKATGIATLYSDGKARSSQNLGSFTPFTTGDLYLAKPDVSTSSFVGAMDEFSVYNRALSAAEIQALYAAGSSGKCVTLPNITLTFDGKLRDKVSAAEPGTSADGQQDGTFTVQIPPGFGSRTIKSLDLDRGDGNRWNTIPNDTFWVLGAANTLDDSLLNDPATGSLSSSTPLSVNSGSSFKVFASDGQASLFDAGKTFTLTAKFSDGNTSTGSVTIAPPAPAVTLSFDGKLRDRVSQSSNADAGPDGQPDGTFTVTLPANSSHTLSSLKLEGPAGNTWDTLPDNGIWVVGAADTLDSPLLNISSGVITGTQVGNSFKIFASDAQPNPTAFFAGATFKLTITFADNSTATASVTLARTPAVDLNVKVTDSPDPVVADSNLTYVIEVGNSGLTLAPNVKANVAIPDETVFVASGPLTGLSLGTSADCLRIGATRNVECTLGNLAPGSTATRQIVVRPTGRLTPITFDVNVTSDLADADSSNNRAKELTAVSANTPPANDNFLNAKQLIGMSGIDDGTNVGATREVPINYGAGRKEAYELNHANVNGGKSVWYFWKPPVSKGTMLLDTQGSNFDTLLAVYAIPVDITDFSMQKELASNNDISQLSPSLAGTYSGLSFQFDSKYVYYFVVDGNQGATGNIVLTWQAIEHHNSTPVVQRIDGGIFPSIVCTTGSTASDICDRFIDSSGYFVLKIKGHNFTADSEVLIKGVSVRNMKGFDRNGKPVSGQLSLTGSTDLEARIPPNPPLNQTDLNSVRVVTRRAGSSGAAGDGVANFSPDAASILTGLADGVYDAAYNSRGLQTFEAKKVEILPGKTQSICLGAIDKPGSETCLDITNKGSSPTQLSPTYFAHAASCLREPTDAAKAQCLLGGLVDQYGVSLNPSGPVDINVTIRKRLDLTPAVLEGIKTAGGKVGFAFEGGKLVAGVISNDGASIVATGGGNLVTDNGSGLITNDGGSLVTNLLNSLITNDGGSLITNDGGSLITNDGGSIIGNDGASFKVTNGLITNDGGSIAPMLTELMYGKGSSTTAAVDGPRVTANSDSSTGVSGLVLAKSSGGQEPTFTTETDPVTGEVKGYVSITLDNTSFPRVSDLNGMVFTAVVNPAVVQFSANNITVNKTDGHAAATLTRTGDTSNAVTVNYRTYDGTANERSDYSPAFGSVTFAPGETSKLVSVPLIDHGYGAADFGAQRKFSIAIVNVLGGAMQAPNFTTVTINNPAATNATVNPLDNPDARFFVRQQYLDFLGREPDQSGWDFWTNNITSCVSNAQCTEVKRIDTSAAFFLSIEFQNTGFLAYRTYNAALDRPGGLPRYAEFMRDKQALNSGLVVLQAGWEQQLENNKQAYLAAFVTRDEFLNLYPVTLSPAEYVDALYAHAQITPSASERQAAIDEFNNADGGARARVLRRVVESSALISRETNRAFVLAQYFGYLRRNPDEAPDTNLDGYNFWLDKLNSFGGDYRRAEMVKAFLSATEYRRRFAQN